MDKTNNPAQDQLTAISSNSSFQEKNAPKLKCQLHYKNTESGPLEVTLTEREGATKKEPRQYYEEALQKLTRTCDIELAQDIFSKGANAMPSKNEARNLNIAAQVLVDSAPRDATEARLRMQEAALYAQGMQFLYRCESENMIPQCEHYMKNAIKLLRLHNETIEALSKYRRGGEQRVVVQHVNVQEGGRAIVSGNVALGEGGDAGKKITRYLMNSLIYAQRNQSGQANVAKISQQRASPFAAFMEVNQQEQEQRLADIGKRWRT
jgi:hypothetical protein